MLSILYQDSDVVVVNKPSGLLVHRSAIDSRETEFAVQLLRDQLGQKVYPVHRLDKPTSGALVFALSQDAARALALEFEAGRVAKTYLAVVRGEAPKTALITHPLKEELDDKSDVMADKAKPAQNAITEISSLGTVELNVQVDKFPTSKYSLVKAMPKTGRKHQIRRHLRHLGHPIIGDVNHGSGKHNRFFRDEFQCRRLLLACTQLSFRHPNGLSCLTVDASLSSDFAKVATSLGFTLDHSDTSPKNIP